MAFSIYKNKTNPCYWLDWCYPFYTLPTPAPPAPAIPTACPGGAGIGPCVNNQCPDRYACFNNNCCPVNNDYGPCVNGQCPMGICNNGRCVG
ncbi:unnamed protein product [Dracunculus medinensis]|uniref:CC domain-containing protein n=1 Tax=Dracunculus medinensis TaxID=318479 RepID=A0A0N4U5F7_DRAME|nr:unnamed protein product [Dracunculus medinensis]